MKKQLALAGVIATVGLSVAACGSNSISTPPVKSSSSYTTKIMDIAWSQQDAKTKRDACTVWRIDPSVAMDAFAAGAGSTAMDSLDVDDIRSFLNDACGTGA